MTNKTSQTKQFNVKDTTFFRYIAEVIETEKVYEAVIRNCMVKTDKTDSNGKAIYELSKDKEMIEFNVSKYPLNVDGENAYQSVTDDLKELVKSFNGRYKYGKKNDMFNVPARLQLCAFKSKSVPKPLIKVLNGMGVTLTKQ